MATRSRSNLLGSMLTRPAALPFAALAVGLTGCPAEEATDTTSADESTGNDDDDTDDTDDSVTLTDPDTTVGPTTDDPSTTTVDPSTTTDDPSTTTDDPSTTTDDPSTTTDDPSTTTDATTGGMVCGDNTAEGGEVCDGDDLAGADCSSQGFAGGALTCLDDCSGFDITGCVDEMNDCADQVVTDVGSPVSNGNLGMDDNDLDASCGGTGGNDLVVEFVAPFDGVFVFDTFGSDFDTKLALFGSCDVDSELVCNDDFQMALSQVELAMTAGQIVLVVVDGYDGEEGNFVLNISAGACGDGMVEGAELCDGDSNGFDCSALGLGANDLACLDDCSGLDVSTCDAPAGFGNCGLAPEADVCLVDEICAGDGAGSAVCIDLACDTPVDCPAAPATGDAPVTCADVANGDGIGDCYLSCLMGETCPDGMQCSGFVCLWAPV